MDIPFSRWYPAIGRRRSRRQYDPTLPIPPSIVTELQTVCKEFRPFPNARAELVTEHCNEVFKGIIGSYGKIKCARAFVAFIGDTTDEYVQEKVGYTGEGVILAATSFQLATCWVAGFFKPESVASLINIGKNERVLGVTPVGHASKTESLEERIMTGFGRTHQRKPLSSLITGLDRSKWPDWVKTSLEAARQAPSAINRQPWSFHVETDAITVSVRTRGAEFNVSKRLDCGIAMLHIQVAAMNCGVSGKWEFLHRPHVVRLKVQ
ncbi:nitroreductase family protein [Chloroflexota bacterium]